MKFIISLADEKSSAPDFDNLDDAILYVRNYLRETFGDVEILTIVDGDLRSFSARRDDGEFPLEADCVIKQGEMMSRRERNMRRSNEKTRAIAMKYIADEISEDEAIEELVEFFNLFHDDRSARLILLGSMEEIRRNTTRVDNEPTTRTMTMEQVAIEKLQKEVAGLKSKNEALAVFFQSLVYKIHAADGMPYLDLLYDLVDDVGKIINILSDIPNIKDPGLDENNNTVE